MTAIELIQIFLDPIKWMNMFPTIVTEARILDFLDSGDMGISIQLMYEKLHILSPLVDAREFLFIHCCKQLDHKTWIMLDVSYDLLKEIQTCAPSYAWKFPSGCIIQDMGYRTSLISRRMVKSFCEILCLTEKLDFSTSSKLNNTYRVSIRENEETIQSKGFIATAATSLWFPFAFKTIFNFLKDDKTRYQF
uniref:START domain-containing protein n=1 Tax=Solanum lycopersicum TaxID=4081 RepID=A0A3Q7IDT6_SOLLC